MVQYFKFTVYYCVSAVLCTVLYFRFSSYCTVPVQWSTLNHNAPALENIQKVQPHQIKTQSRCGIVQTDSVENCLKLYTRVDKQPSSEGSSKHKCPPGITHRCIVLVLASKTPRDDASTGPVLTATNCSSCP